MAGDQQIEANRKMRNTTQVPNPTTEKSGHEAMRLDLDVQTSTTVVGTVRGGGDRSQMISRMIRAGRPSVIRCSRPLAR